MTTTLWIIVGVIVLVVLWLIATFNSLITARNQVQEAWSDIDVQLKRRHDLIPNLIATVKGYAAHERQLFEKVTEARSRAISAQATGNIAKSGQAENMLTDALKSLFAVAEAYPELKANENFAKLQDELSDTENKIQAARRFYNGNVRDYNTKLQVFPTNLLGGMMGFQAREFFELDDVSEKKTPQVKF